MRTRFLQTSRYRNRFVHRQHLKAPISSHDSHEDDLGVELILVQVPKTSPRTQVAEAARASRYNLFLYDKLEPRGLNLHLPPNTLDSLRLYTPQTSISIDRKVVTMQLMQNLTHKHQLSPASLLDNNKISTLHQMSARYFEVLQQSTRARESDCTHHINVGHASRCSSTGVRAS